MSGSGISWAIRKSAPCSRQITTPAPDHWFFTGRMPFLPPNQQHQSTEGQYTYIIPNTYVIPLVRVSLTLYSVLEVTFIFIYNTLILIFLHNITFSTWLMAARHDSVSVVLEESLLSRPEETDVHSSRSGLDDLLKWVFSMKLSMPSALYGWV